MSLANGSTGTVQLIGDVAGYYLSGAPTQAGAFVSLAPSRVLDTRTMSGRRVRWRRGLRRRVQVTGRGGVPASGVSAVVLNVTVTAPARSGFVTVFPEGTAQPTASNVNFVAGQTIANLVVVKVGASGKVSLANGSSGTVQLIGDVAGYYLSGAPTQAGAFVSLAPSRVLDTRTGVGAPGPVAAGAGGVGAGHRSRWGAGVRGVGGGVERDGDGAGPVGLRDGVPGGHGAADRLERELRCRADDREPGGGQGRCERQGVAGERLVRVGAADR